MVLRIPYERTVNIPLRLAAKLEATLVCKKIRVERCVFWIYSVSCLSRRLYRGEATKRRYGSIFTRAAERKTDNDDGPYVLSIFMFVKFP